MHPTRGASLTLFLMVAAFLAGCADGPATTSQDEVASAVAVPPACDADRPAVVHGAGGTPVEWDGPTGFPCLGLTEWGTGEPSLGLTSDGSLFLYPAFDPPAIAPLVGQFSGMGIARSQDGGQSFTRHTSNVGPANYHPYTADPFMYVDPHTDRVFIEDLLIPPFNCANLSFSDDGGETWTQTLAGCFVWDHVGWASGPPAVSSPSYPVVIQRCAITYVATTLASTATGCQKSLDGGMTWELPGEPAFMFDQDGQPYVPSTCHGAAHHPFVDHRGWTWLARIWCDGNPWVAVSKDEGATWTQHQIGTGAAAWHDVGVGVDTNGTVFAFWIDEDLRPVLAVSHDDGLSWSAPIDVAPPGVTAAGMANIQPGGVGKAAFTYGVEIEGASGTHAVAAAGYGLDMESPRFHSAIATMPDDPLNDGGCSEGLCSGQADFLDAAIGPDGAPWGSFSHQGNVAGGGLWGAPSLWDESDPNGPYAD